MASLNSTITVTHELRPCIWRRSGAKALFHKWVDVAENQPFSEGNIGGIVKDTLALIEFDNGKIAKVYAHEIQFTDNKFNEYVFRNNVD
ncbi:hypothetical protein ACPA0F_09010 [Solibacillus silvestris]